MNIESLEQRTLFSLIPVAGVLTITGTVATASDATDQFELSQSGGTVTFKNLRTGFTDTSTGSVTQIVVSLLDGNDTVSLVKPDGSNPVTIKTFISGGNGNDTIIGGNAGDSLNGDAGNDVIQGRGGSDDIVGGSGFDIVDYSYSSTAVTVKLDGLVNDGVVGVDNDNAREIEGIVGSTGNDTLIGSDAGNYLDGGAGNDKIQGRGGSDDIIGGAGFDTADYSYSTAAVTVRMDGNVGDGTPGVDNDNVRLDIEAVIGGTGSDTLIGNDSANSLDGGPGVGSDSLFGLGGNDTLTGGDGPNDSLQGGSGNDYLFSKDGKTDGINDGPDSDSALIDSLAAGQAVDDVPVAAANPPAAFAAALRMAFAAALEEAPTPSPSELDPVFGNNGVTINYLGQSLSISKILTQDVFTPSENYEEMILVSGSVLNINGDFDFFVARLRANGELDTTFGDDDISDEFAETRLGFALVDFSNDTIGASDDTASDIGLDSYNRIILVGTSATTLGASSFAISRLESNGTLDTFFGDDDPFAPELEPRQLGTATYAFGSLASKGYGLSISGTDTGEGILHNYSVVGDVDGNVGFMRFNEFGYVSFDGFGPAYIDDGAIYTYATAVTTDDAGNLWMAVVYDSGTTATTSIVGLYASGAVATSANYSFESTGSVFATDIAVQNNRLVMVGRVIEDDVSSRGMIVAVDIEETGFDVENDRPIYSLTNAVTDVVGDPLGSGIAFESVGFDEDGRAVAAGTAQTDVGNGNFAVYRFFTNDLTGDDTFNNGQAIVETDIGEDSLDAGIAVTVPNYGEGGYGQIIVAGLTRDTGEMASGSLAVVKYISGEGSSEPKIAEIILTDEDLETLVLKYIDEDGIEQVLPDYLITYNDVPTLVFGELVINGTEGDDQIVVTQFLSDDGVTPIIFVQFDGERYVAYDATFITNVVVNGLGGNDTIQTDDTLTVPIAVYGGEGNDTLLHGRTPDADGAVFVGPAGNNITVDLYGEAGDDTFQISHSKATVNAYGGEDNDTINVIASLAGEVDPPVVGDEEFQLLFSPPSDPAEFFVGGAITVEGGAGDDVLSIKGTKLNDEFTINQASVTGSGLDVAITDDIESLNVFGRTGDDTFHVQSTGETVSTTLDGAEGIDTINVGSGFSAGAAVSGSVAAILGALSLFGGAEDPTLEIVEDDVLNIDDSLNTEAVALTLSADVVEGFAATINYAQFESVDLTLGSGEDDVTIVETHAGQTTVNTGDGSDYVAVQAISGLTTVNGGEGDEVIDIGDESQTLVGIKASLNLNGDAPSASDTFNINNSGDNSAVDSTLTASAFTSSAFAGQINYGSVEHLAITTGDGVDTFNVQGTSAETQINTAGGADVINVSSDSPANGGNLDDIDGVLSIDAGAGKNTLNVSDAGAAAADAAVVITSNSITGLAPVAINYDATTGNFNGGVFISGGSGGNIISVASTRTTAGVIERTILKSGQGADTVTVQQTNPSFMVIEGQNGADNINASATTTGVVIFGNEGNDTLTGGSGKDILIGDNGRVYYKAAQDEPNVVLGGAAAAGVFESFTADAAALTPELITTADAGTGGNDDITAGAGNDIVLGGTGGDVVKGGLGNDIILGDNGEVHGNNGSTNALAIFSNDSIASTGGSDDLSGEDDSDIVIGGVGGDTVSGGAATDYLLGDGARVLTDASLVVLKIESTTPLLGGSDVINGGDAADYLIGGSAGDTVNGGIGADVIFGDFGKIDFALPAVSNFTSLFTQNSDNGGNDTVHGDAGDDTVLGGQGADTLYGDADHDDLIGGHNVASGQDGGDAIDGGTGNDVAVGDNATVTRRADTVTPLVRTLSATALQNTTTGNANVNATAQANPTGAVARNITLLDHSNTTAAGLYGNDSIAGGAGNDQVFGQLGNDTLQGDASIANVVSATTASVEASTDGDDYIEGNGGDDLIFGNYGQDDLIGGSSDQFGLTTAAQRPDGSDTIFGGAGTRVDRNNFGDTSTKGHAADADVILGDNGNIFRIVSAGKFVSYTYDGYDSAAGVNALKIIPRAYTLLDYTNGVGGTGAADLVQGEAGDDVIHGQAGNDVLFGNAQDDNVIGGVGFDRIYGGTGDDGVLGDDGLIFTSRNSKTEALNGLNIANAQTTLALSGPFTGAVEYIAGQLLKTVKLFTPTVGNHDVIYGGLGNDFLHGGAGDDAISGAEATAAFYSTQSVSNFDPLGYNATTRKFAAFNAPLAFSKIANFLLNFDAAEGVVKVEDGKDRIFGDNGNDWLVGGTGHDRLFGGLGDDLLNADDNHDTNGGLNNLPDAPNYADADFAYGGNGLDVLIANTGADRLFDGNGNYNTFLVPFSSFGNPTVERSSSSKITAFLAALGKASGADQSLVEPNGELGLSSGESGTGRDAQPTNIIGSRDTQGGPENDVPAGAAAVTLQPPVNMPGTAVFAADVVTSGKNSIYVFGTSGNDVIEVRASTKKGSLDVVRGTTVIGTYAGVYRVYIWGGAGDDKITIQTSAGALPALIYGEDGNDTLTSGLGVAYLDGGANNDTLKAGSARNLLVGGVGLDQLTGGVADDLLIGGTLDYIESFDAHTALLAEWTRTDKTYAQRVTNLKTGAGLALGFVVSPVAPIVTVLDDGVADSLLGAGGLDWFLGTALDTSDRKTSGTGLELLN